MPRKLKAFDEKMDGSAARTPDEPLLESPETHLPAPAPEARKAQAKHAKNVADEERALELEESQAALERIQQEIGTMAGIAEHVGEIAKMRKAEQRKTAIEKDEAAVAQIKAVDEFGPSFEAGREIVDRNMEPTTDEQKRKLAIKEAIDMYRNDVVASNKTRQEALAGTLNQEAVANELYYWQGKAEKIERQIQTLQSLSETFEGPANTDWSVDDRVLKDIRRTIHELLKATDQPKRPEAVQAPELAQLIEKEDVQTPRFELAKDPTLYEHLALSEAARVRSYFLQKRLERNELTDDNSWEFLHELRNRELDLEGALGMAWDRDTNQIQLPEAVEERRALTDALMEVQGVTSEIRAKLEAKTVQQEFEEQYANARVKAFEKRRVDLNYNASIREKLEKGSFSPDAPTQWTLTLQKKAEAFERDMARLDALETDTKNSFENSADYEYTEQVLTDTRNTLHLLIRAEQDARKGIERQFPVKTVEQVAKELELVGPGGAAIETAKAESKIPTDALIKTAGKRIEAVEAQMAAGLMSQDERDAAIIDLSKTYADLEEKLHGLLLGPAGHEQTMTDRATVADQLHDIDRLRATLSGAEGWLQASAETPQMRQLLKKSESAADLKAMQREIKTLKRDEPSLASAVRKVYGVNPEDIVAKGGHGLRGLLRRGLDRVVGKDVYGAWKKATDRINELEALLDPALTARNVSGEAQTKMAMSEELEAIERERIEQRVAAAEYRKTNRLQKISDNIAQNAAAELLSFGPEEYTNQLRLVADATEEAEGAAGRAAYTAKRRLMAATKVLDEMQNELREYGINLVTGEEVRSVGPKNPNPAMESVTRRRATTARRNRSANGLSIET